MTSNLDNSQKNGYMRIPIDMGVYTEGVSQWYSNLQDRLRKKGIICSIEANEDGKATLITEEPYGADVITQIRQIMMEAVSDDLNPKKTRKSLLRTALKNPIYI